MRKTEKQGDLFGCYQPQREISVKDICKIFNGKVISQEQYDAEISLLKPMACGESGEWLVRKVQKEGVFWWVKPRNIK